jgi:hypothetical protein
MAAIPTYVLHFHPKRRLWKLTATGKYKLPEEKIEDDAKVSIVSYEPLGVVAAICPWNCMLVRAMFKHRIFSNFFLHMAVPLMLGNNSKDLCIEKEN